MTSCLILDWQFSVYDLKHVYSSTDTMTANQGSVGLAENELALIPIDELIQTMGTFSG